MYVLFRRSDGVTLRTRLELDPVIGAQLLLDCPVHVDQHSVSRLPLSITEWQPRARASASLYARTSLLEPLRHKQGVNTPTL